MSCSNEEVSRDGTKNSLWKIHRVLLDQDRRKGRQKEYSRNCMTLNFLFKMID